MDDPNYGSEGPNYDLDNPNYDMDGPNYGFPPFFVSLFGFAVARRPPPPRNRKTEKRKTKMSADGLPS